MHLFLYLNDIFTDHVRSTREGDVFTSVCLFTEEQGINEPPKPLSRQGDFTPQTE